ncbi:hypothetical protein CFP59_03956 [Streptomyces malaysiensis subsp. malaysiensis]|nr:hypothetical protein CFP59_03956 [Streptomyces sp. M56]SCF60152.1 hypothetical protein GA0115260_1002010 [Streptomyces sp. MnatMP-M27]
MDTELETHVPVATGTTRTATRAARVHHRTTIIGHNHQPARVSVSGPDSNRKASPKSEPPRAKWRLNSRVMVRAVERPSYPPELRKRAVRTVAEIRKV